MKKPTLDPAARESKTVLIWLFVLRYVLLITAEIVLEAFWGASEMFEPEPGAEPMGLVAMVIVAILWVAIAVAFNMITLFPLFQGRKWAYWIYTWLVLFAVALRGVAAVLYFAVLPFTPEPLRGEMDHYLPSLSDTVAALIYLITPIYLLQSKAIKRYFEYKRELRAFKKQLKKG